MQQYSPDGVRQERTNWRCQEISARHRVWGFNCPAVDLDFLAVEYNLGKPVALVEYKHYSAAKPVYKHPTYAALAALANGYSEGALPFLLTFYWPESWTFEVHPLNRAAAQWFEVAGILSERDYVRALYAIRRKTLTDHLEKVLISSVPETLAGREAA